MRIPDGLPADRSAGAGAPIPDWALRRPKSAFQQCWDFLLIPARMALLPDRANELMHATSLRAERFAAVLPEIKGRLLDVGAGDNMLCRLYARHIRSQGGNQIDAETSVGVDVVEWGGGAMLIKSSDQLPFDNASFDTVSFIACLNHIPERAGALREARRVLKPNGTLLITMIGRAVGEIGHRIWWYSEDKHRDVHHDEEMGMDRREMEALLRDAEFRLTAVKRFVYGLNYLYIARSPPIEASRL